MEGDSLCKDDEAFLRQYFDKELWKDTRDDDGSTDGDSGKTDEEAGETVIVRELEEDLDEVENAEKWETQFNFRYELGKNALPGRLGHKIDDMFDVIKPPSKRALKEKERRARKRERLAEEKKSIVGDLLEGIEKTTTKTSDLIADEDYPSDQEWLLCDHCMTAVMPDKIIFVCNECPDYVLCKPCQKSKVKHDHPLKRSKCPSSAVPPKSWKLCVEPKADSVEAVTMSTGKVLAAQILQELNFVPDGTFKYIECQPEEEKRTLDELLAEAEQTESQS